MKGIAKKRIAQFEGLKKKYSVIDIDVLRALANEWALLALPKGDTFAF
jgi:hypothetical protein